MKHLLLWALAVLILVITGTRAARAHAERSESLAALTLVTQQASELVRLRHAAKDSSLPIRPETGLAGKVSQALSRSGLVTGFSLGTGTPGADLPLRVVVTMDAIFKERPRAELRPGASR